MWKKYGGDVGNLKMTYSEISFQVINLTQCAALISGDVEMRSFRGLIEKN